MADDDNAKPIGDGDITPPPATTEFQAAEPLKNSGVDFTPEGSSGDAGSGSAGSEGSFGQAKQSARDNLSGLGQQATDKAREFADMGKERVGGLLDQLAQMLTDAAGQVDEKLGEQYGAHARTAATSIQGFAQTVRDKNVDEFADDVRGYVNKSPAVALGVAAAFGFGLARLVHSGLDQRG